MLLWLNLFFGSPSQTYIENIKARFPNRMLPEKLVTDYDFKKCEFCGDKQKHARSSHCSTCKVCVLKRDHHCPWISKCVGYNNIQYFWCYLWWMMFFGVMYFLGVFKFYKYSSHYGIIMKLLVFGSSMFTMYVAFNNTGLIMSNSLSFLNDYTFYETTKVSGIETYYVCTNKTDLSYAEYNPYNKGFLFNWKISLGPTLFHLIFPIRRRIDTDIPELEYTFYKNKQIRDYDKFKALSGTKYKGLDEIIKDQFINNDPKRYIEASKMRYSGNFQII